MAKDNQTAKDKLEDQWIEVFRAGTQTDSAGNTKTWTEKDLDDIADKYNNQPQADKHEAPVVVGHPETDAPAYGWVEKLKRTGDTLLAKFKQVDTAFADLVKAGRLKKRSISLYADKKLKHIGFLGAVPPAVKGLADAKFNNDEPSFTYEYAKGDPETADAEAAAATADTEGVKFEEGDEVEVAVKTRSDRWKIEPKAQGKKTKPAQYADLDDEQFADPVNYRFPLASKYIRASLATWNREVIRKQYSESESDIVSGRIIKSAKENNIKLDNYKWAFTEGKPLNQKQTNNSTNNTKKEFSMDETLWGQITSDLLAAISETLGEESATQISPKLDKLKAKYIKAADAAAGGKVSNNSEAGEGVSNNSEASEEVKQLRRRVEELETSNRLAEHNSFCEKLTKDGKLIPAQRDFAIAILELGHKNGETSFAESGKVVKKSALDLVKNFMESIPAHDLFEEKAGKANARANYSSNEDTSDFSEDSVELDAKITKYMEDQVAKGNKDITYTEARIHLLKENN